MGDKLFEPRPRRRKQVNLRVYDVEFEALKSAAESRGVAVSQLVRMTLSDYFMEIIPECEQGAEGTEAEAREGNTKTLGGETW